MAEGRPNPAATKVAKHRGPMEESVGPLAGGDAAIEDDRRTGPLGLSGEELFPSFSLAEMVGAGGHVDHDFRTLRRQGGDRVGIV